MKVYKRRVSPLGFPVCLSGRENEWIWGKWLRCPWFWWPDLYSRIFCFYGWLSFLREGDFKRERTSERAEGSVAATLSFFLCFKSKEKKIYRVKNEAWMHSCCWVFFLLLLFNYFSSAKFEFRTALGFFLPLLSMSVFRYGQMTVLSRWLRLFSVFQTAFTCHYLR
jgi:hypothetical protein